MKKVIYAKKRFGQNFLKDQNIINKIVGVFNFENSHVLEIGPGRGALTKELIKKASKVTCYEIDPDMVAVLNKQFQNEPNLKIINQDFLQANLSQFQNAYIIANIPYYITTDILFKIFDYKNQFKGVLLMVQKEVALRMSAQKNTPEYSKLSISCQYLANVKNEFIVKASSFSPTPSVDSAVVSLVFRQDISQIQWQQIKDFFKTCFANRRKKLLFALSKVYIKEYILNVFQQLNLPENVRIQQLDINQIVQIFEKLNQEINQ
ncbi:MULTISPECIES: 16S rRNA (adenine(1518)-N(6)/adenine(1519)-N(6))-dimethyltransferase RsmA [unclassified Mycoplasma]|uniref:16S rRNA (adenine(1518)-N(6)/adenine(1519)-N(6))- dimethyltransferase RsmA n=1 Tax=unclassified Mycoplasma TaxID=2683645 RepID=UPI00211D0D5E|nr:MULTISPECIES: 16S rRNA (adenine(1518)-N(6)/adenine(1519)-N(6))-dimethyltransferase RsmA [unclassified Mycoplasma]UUM19854.1 16S rRNA (adenine(1518)-N(6)/adenine(1519)-N(6))-dimethyltransferase RsmA [Mycoplasma sp. 1578d]UUM24838.1 16S rRNA (adenine(1518)-N(6)/adenine(1519)-N(6))-dimethyltransferase RsmA [Mycoplasma sp. 3686d]